jgi:hypothetical protein
MESDQSLEVVETLADVAATDSEYRHFYLQRARALLTHIMSPATFGSHRQQQARLPEQRSALRRAIGVGNWQEVRDLARQIQASEDDLRRHARQLTVAERVYSPDRLPAPTALAAHAVSPLGPAQLADCQARTVAHLEHLATADQDFRGFYQDRRAAITSLGIGKATGRAAVDHGAMLTQAKDALERNQWERLAALAQNLLEGGRGERTEHAEHSDCGCGAAVLSSPDVNGPIPATSTGQDYGFAPVHLDRDDEIRTYLACRCAEVPALMDRPLTPETLELFSAACGCHERCPALHDSLRVNVDFLKHRAFITSLGTRYLPSLVAETLLVEEFQETLDAPRGRLLERLRLPSRVGLCREEIEEALAMRGAEVAEEIGVDPVRYVMIPIPFDAYLRAAPGRGWGRKETWTHFDGYQVLRGWHLRALVGGDTRFGGPHDLCGIGPSDRRENVLLRLAVVHRDRMANQLAEGSRADGL